MRAPTLEGADTGGPGALAAAGALLASLLGLLALLGGAQGALVGSSGSVDSSSPGVSAQARAEIPPEYLRLYEDAAARYGLDWAILAGIGRVECDHGQDPDPSCTQQGVENAAGAGGPMQFLASTWAQYGVDADGGGAPNRWDPADAIFGAANYLRASGAPGDYREAVYAYNHAWWYVEEVQAWAARYSAGAGAEQLGAGALSATALEGAGTPIIAISGERARLDPGEGHVALIPTGVPAAVQAMLIAGNELQDLPYGPDGHPDPLGAPDEDCSSTVNFILYSAGVRPLSEIIADNPLAQSYMRWGDPGPGRWVTIYATEAPTPHVFMVIAGLRLDTSHDGTDVGPNSDEDGPRWRILDHIPTWAHWSVRHPPGL